MAIEFLRDTRDLGKNWHLSFLQHHPDLKSMISSPRNVDRIIAQDRRTLIRLFDLFLEQKEKHRVHENDIYNIDEKGVALGVAGKERVIIPKTEKTPHTSGGSGSREWVTATETCSLTERILSSWTVFKGIKPLINGMIPWKELVLLPVDIIFLRQRMAGPTMSWVKLTLKTTLIPLPRNL
jgi:hypothetical protein